ALMRAMPNMVVLAPADNREAARMGQVIAEYPGPVYMRISRAVVPDVFDDSLTVANGNGITLRDGGDVTIIGCGRMVGRCLRAADRLAQEGIDARVLSMASIKPLDAELVVLAAQETGALVTAEDHTILGGLGSAVVEALAEHHPAPVEFVGLKDTFA